MKFIGKHLNAIGLVLLFSFASAAAALYFDAPSKMSAKRVIEKKPAAGCAHQNSSCCAPAKTVDTHAGCSHGAAAD
ncbi:MAG TPA: hypothetical protein PKA41_19310 [Verrucomicrobiota bacterium]|nr:hypothetical protein [Verrucomicrobiota bacterium]